MLKSTLIALTLSALALPLCYGRTPADLTHLQPSDGALPPQLPQPQMEGESLHAMVDWRLLEDLGDRVLVEYVARVRAPELAERLGRIQFVVVQESGRGILHRFSPTTAEVQSGERADDPQHLGLRASFELSRRSWERWQRGLCAPLAIEHLPERRTESLPLVRSRGLQVQEVAP